MSSERLAYIMEVSRTKEREQALVGHTEKAYSNLCRSIRQR